jgi:hypothetical protein
MKSLYEHTLTRAIQYHLDSSLPIYENVFRSGTPLHFELIKEIKKLYESDEYITLDDIEESILQTDIGEWEVYEGKAVPLDYPMFTEEKEPELNKPKRGGSKKFYVYVRDPDTKKIKKVEWGDTSGLTMKISDPAARKSFAARHNCADKKDRTTPGYWACNVPKYGKQLGLSPDSSGSFFW